MTKERNKGCGRLLSGGCICGKYNVLCYKCNHGDGEDRRSPRRLRNRAKESERETVIVMGKKVSMSPL